MVLNLCILSDDALYLYQVSSQRVSKFLSRQNFFLTNFVKLSQRVWELLCGHNIHSEICKGALFLQKCRWSYGSCSLYILR